MEAHARAHPRTEPHTCSPCGQWPPEWSQSGTPAGPLPGAVQMFVPTWAPGARSSTKFAATSAEFCEGRNLEVPRPLGGAGVRPSSASPQASAFVAASFVQISGTNIRTRPRFLSTPAVRGLPNFRPPSGKLGNLWPHLAKLGPNLDKPCSEWIQGSAQFWPHSVEQGPNSAAWANY